MAAADVDVGELIRNLIQQESEIIRSFEEKEASVDKARKGVDAKVAKLLESERKKAGEQAKRLQAEEAAASVAECSALLAREEERIKAFEKSFEKDRRRLVESSLTALLKEVSDALSAQRL